MMRIQHFFIAMFTLGMTFIAAPAFTAGASHAGQKNTFSPSALPSQQRGLKENSTFSGTSPANSSKAPEKKGKYSNVYDRRVPLQGDTHEGYKGVKRDPYKRP